MITRQYTSFEVVNLRFMWISRIGCSSENLGEFRIRGLQIGLYLRNISNENLGVDRLYTFQSRPSRKKTKLKLTSQV